MKSFLKYCILLTFSFSSLLCFSQTYEQLHPRNRIISNFEIVGGLGILKNYGFYVHDQRKYGALYGIGVSHSFSKWFDLGVRVSQEFKGDKVNYTIGIKDKGSSHIVDERFTTDSDFTYLTFSLLPTFRIGHQKNMLFGLGGYYSVLQRATVNNDITDLSTMSVTHSSNSIMSNFSPKYDYGASLFGGYQIHITERTRCSMQIVYNTGFVNQVDFYNNYFVNRSVVFILSLSISNKSLF